MPVWKEEQSYLVTRQIASFPHEEKLRLALHTIDQYFQTMPEWEIAYRNLSL